MMLLFLSILCLIFICMVCVPFKCTSTKDTTRYHVDRRKIDPPQLCKELGVDYNRVSEHFKQLDSCRMGKPTSEGDIIEFIEIISILMNTHNIETDMAIRLYYKG